MKNKQQNIERETGNEVERILQRMTPLEKELLGRAGGWILKNGRHYDPELSRYVCRCSACKHYYTAKRCDSKTCSEACKKARQRLLAKRNFSRSSQLALPSHEVGLIL